MSEIWMNSNPVRKTLRGIPNRKVTWNHDAITIPIITLLGNWKSPLVNPPKKGPCHDWPRAKTFSYFGNPAVPVGPVAFPASMSQEAGPPPLRQAGVPRLLVVWLYRYMIRMSCITLVWAISMPRAINPYNRLIFNGFRKNRNFVAIKIYGVFWRSYVIVGARNGKLPQIFLDCVDRFHFDAR